MRCLILGGTGMLGQAVVAEARARRQAALGLSRAQADICDPQRLRYWMDSYRPELVVNCAAYTKVDACEGEGRERAFAVNGAAVGLVAAAAERAGARFVHVSTDYVFDGRPEPREPYREDAPTHPLSVYGQSKLEGERQALAHGNALVVRTSWLFGPGGPNFVATMVSLIERGQLPLRVVDDQVGGPTYTPFLAKAILDLAPLPIAPLAPLAPLSNIVHYRNRGQVSWYELAREVAELWSGPGPSAEVVPVATAEFPRPAPRPAYSVLDVSRFEAAVGRRAEPWAWGLAEYLARIRHGGLR